MTIQVQRGFFNGLPISRGAERLPKALVESGAVISSGQPADLGGNITGFVDPRTGTYRTLPVEILPAGKPTGPLYHPESMGTQLALPFRVKGSIGMVHSLDDADDASSEFFILTEDLLANSSLTSQLDGAYSLFGFILDGVEDISLIAAGDTILSARVISGSENLRKPNFNPVYTGRAAGNSQRDYQMLGGEGLGEYENALPADVPLAPGDGI